MNDLPGITAPQRAVQWLLDKSQYPVLIAGSLCFVMLMLPFVLSGAIYPVNIPPYDANPLEITGGVLMTAVLPAYLLMCFTANERRRQKNHAAIRLLVSNEIEINQLRSRGLALWPLGIVFGLFNAAFNVNYVAFSTEPSDPAFAVSLIISIGQIIMWLVVGVVLFFSIHESTVLHHVSKHVDVNLYGIDKLNGFGEAALSNFLMIAGALAITALQALDLEFRWYNYRNGLLVGIPAALMLVPLPIWNLHRRIMKSKAQLLEQIDAQISKTSTALQGDELHQMNGLLLRREQISGSRNWPMNISIASRFLAYAFIVPAAWAGAALMEIVLDVILGR